MSTGLRIGIHGAAGRMGQRLIALAEADPELTVMVALEDARSPHLGKDAGEMAGIGKIGTPLTSEITDVPDVIIDFSVPHAIMALLETCQSRRIPLVIATTGLTTEQKQRVAEVAQTIPLLMAPSMSLAVNVGMKLVKEAGRLLKGVPEGVDVEVIERHHRFKEDAPSGTALHFGRIVAEEMGQTEHIHGRQGRPGKRPRTEIGYHALRVGDNVGEHTIVFGLMGETLEVTVKGHTRDSYAYGALAAAKFLVTKGPGLYNMADVLGID